MITCEQGLRIARLIKACLTETDLMPRLRAALDCDVLIHELTNQMTGGLLFADTPLSSTVYPGYAMQGAHEKGAEPISREYKPEGPPVGFRVHPVTLAGCGIEIVVEPEGALKNRFVVVDLSNGRVCPHSPCVCLDAGNAKTCDFRSGAST